MLSGFQTKTSWPPRRIFTKSCSLPRLKQTESREPENISGDVAGAKDAGPSSVPKLATNTGSPLPTQNQSKSMFVWSSSSESSRISLSNCSRSVSAFLLNLLVYSTCVSGCRRADSGVGTNSSSSTSSTGTWTWGTTTGLSWESAGSTRLSFLRCSSNSAKRFLHSLLCLIPGASMPLSHAGHRRVGSKRDTSGEVLSELSGLPMATSAVSAGDVGDGVTETRDGSAGTSCGVTATFDLANGTAGAKRNSPDFFFTLLDSGKTSLGCEGAGKLWPFNFRNSSGGSWLISAGAVPLSFTIWGLLPTVPVSNWVKTPCPEFKSHLKGEIALMFLATKRINSALPSTRMRPCTTGPRSNPMWMKVHSTFLVESGECCRIESGISAKTWAPNKVETGLDNFLPETISNGLLSEPRDVEKWLLHKAKYVKTSTKFSCENVTSNPCAFRSALSTEKDSFNSLTARSADPIDRCCCGAALRIANVYRPVEVPMISPTALSLSVWTSMETAFEVNPKCWSHTTICLLAASTSSPTTT